MQSSPNIRMSVKNMQERMSINRPITAGPSPTRVLTTSFVDPSNPNSNYLIGISEAKTLVVNQTKDVEIERLNTTNFTLQNKVSVKDDLKRNIEMVKKRIEEQNYLNSLVEAQNLR